MAGISTGPMAGKTVLVTGGTGGIGKATAAGLAAMGARGGITGRDPARTWAAAADVATASGNPAVDPFAVDVSSQAEGVTGTYFADRKPKTSSRSSYDTAAAVRLWQISLDLVAPTASV